MAPVTPPTPQPAQGGDETLMGVPRWALAAAAGGLLAAGLTYYFMSSGKEKKKGGKKKGKKGEGQKPDVSTPSSTPSKKQTAVSIEDLPDDEDDLLKAKDPAVKAMAAKDKGNKYFKGGRYELAIQCYNQAIESCPQGKSNDLATFYQNRAAAYEQLDNSSAVVNDCTMALRHNPRYVKALERRARALRKQAEKLDESDKKIEKLKTALEDMTAVCILEGFSKQEHMILVDSMIKELGREEAKNTYAKRDCCLASTQFIKQYLESFEHDPVHVAAKDFQAEEDVDSLRGFKRALACLKSFQFESVISACDEELSDLTNGVEGLNATGDVEQIADGEATIENGLSEETSSDFAKHGARLLRATFYILSKKQKEAMQDLTVLIDDPTVEPSIKSNALIKRASLHIQQCTDPEKDPLLSFKDFESALDVDPQNPDVYFHRGQVFLLTEQIEKAVQDFNKSVELNPTFPTAYVQKLYTDYRQAMQLNNQEKVNNVINLFEEAMVKFPECIETYALFSQVLSDQQNFERADACYEKALKVDANNANLWVHKGLIQLQWKGDIKTAIEYIERAIKIDDKCEFAYETLGTVEVQRGNLKRSVELFEKAIPLANTELEMAHLYGLMDAANAQLVIAGRYGLDMRMAM